MNFERNGEGNDNGVKMAAVKGGMDTQNRKVIHRTQTRRSSQLPLMK